MKIAKIETSREQIALKKPFITSLRRADAVEFVRVKLVCEDGSLLFGEAPATKAITGEDRESIVASIELIKAQLIGLEIAEALLLLPTCQIGSSARAALDIALNFTTCQMPKARELYTAVTISLDSIEKMYEDAKEAVANGMWILKLKLSKDIPHAIEITKLLSRELQGAKLYLDPNQAWSLEQSALFLEAIAGVEVALLEQPVAAKEIDSLRRITAMSHIPIVADEAVFTLEDAKRVIESKSADIINIKLMKCGGVGPAREILEYAKSMGVGCMMGSMLESALSINAAITLAMEYEQSIWHVDLDSPLLWREEQEALEYRYSGCKIEKKSARVIEMVIL